MRANCLITMPQPGFCFPSSESCRFKSSTCSARQRIGPLNCGARASWQLYSQFCRGEAAWRCGLCDELRAFSLHPQTCVMAVADKRSCSSSNSRTTEEAKKQETAGEDEEEVRVKRRKNQ